MQPQVLIIQIVITFLRSIALKLLLEITGILHDQLPCHASACTASPKPSIRSLVMQITADKSNDLKRGTRITLFLKEDAKELADDKKLGELIKQYSEFIQFPIRLWQSKVKTEEVLITRSVMSCSL